MNFTCFRMFKKCVKIGEGVFGEVFRTERRNQSLALKVDTLYIFFSICKSILLFSRKTSAISETEEQ